MDKAQGVGAGIVSRMREAWGEVTPVAAFLGVLVWAGVRPTQAWHHWAFYIALAWALRQAFFAWSEWSECISGLKRWSQTRELADELGREPTPTELSLYSRVAAARALTKQVWCWLGIALLLWIGSHKLGLHLNHRID